MTGAEMRRHWYVTIAAVTVAFGLLPPATSGAETTVQYGTNSWRLTQPALAGEIEGYSSRVSGTPGTPVDLHVSTVEPWFTVTAYRFGDYTGGDAHRVWASGQITGEEQGDAIMQPAATRTVVAPWGPSVTVPTIGWTPGVYLFKLTAANGLQAHIPYIVRSPSTAGTTALVLPVTTWQAYNTWGGYSLYTSPPGEQRSWAVSFDRPYATPGTAGLPFNVLDAVLLAERMNTSVSYLANTDLSVEPEALAGARAYVSIGHDEYWTREMRDAVLTAREAGTNLAFLGANTMYWRIRLEPNAKGSVGRVVVGYKWDARDHDPLYFSEPEQATTRWRDKPAPEPENALTGMQYECHPVDADYQVATPGWWGFRNTGVSKGTSFARLVGVEADRVYPISSTPRPLQVLSFTSYSCRGVPTSSQSTYYTTPSGAGVFNAGTLRWVCAISRGCGPLTLDAATNRFVRTTTRNLLRVFANGPAGLTHPARDNVSDFPLPLENQVPAS
jgi:hypothetical protein